MKVIERQLLDTEYPAVCDYCNSTFVFNILTDLIRFFNKERVNDAWVKCPVCGRESLFSFHRKRHENKLRRDENV